MFSSGLMPPVMSPMGHRTTLLSQFTMHDTMGHRAWTWITDLLPCNPRISLESSEAATAKNRQIMLPEPGGPSMHPKRAFDPDVAEISASAPDSMASGIGCLEAQCLSPEEANDCSTKMLGTDEAMEVHTKRLLDSEMQSESIRRSSAATNDLRRSKQARTPSVSQAKQWISE